MDLKILFIIGIIIILLIILMIVKPQFKKAVIGIISLMTFSTVLYGVSQNKSTRIIGGSESDYELSKLLKTFNNTKNFPSIIYKKFRDHLNDFSLKEYIKTKSDLKQFIINLNLKYNVSGDSIEDYIDVNDLNNTKNVNKLLKNYNNSLSLVTDNTQRKDVYSYLIAYYINELQNKERKERDNDRQCKRKTEKLENDIKNLKEEFKEREIKQKEEIENKFKIEKANNAIQVSNETRQKVETKYKYILEELDKSHSENLKNLEIESRENCKFKLKETKDRLRKNLQLKCENEKKEEVEQAVQQNTEKMNQKRIIELRQDHVKNRERLEREINKVKQEEQEVYNQLEEQFAEYKKTSKSDYTKLKHRYNDIVDENDKIHKKYFGCDSKIKELQSLNNNLNLQFERATKEHNTCEEEVKKIKSQNTQLKNYNEELNENLNQEKTENENNKNKIISLEENNTTLDLKNKDLLSKNSTLQISVNEYKSQNDKLNTDLNNVRELNNDLMQKNKTLTENNTTLNNKNIVLNKNISSCESSKNQISKNLKSWQGREDDIIYLPIEKKEKKENIKEKNIKKEKNNLDNSFDEYLKQLNNKNNL